MYERNGGFEKNAFYQERAIDLSDIFKAISKKIHVIFLFAIIGSVVVVLSSGAFEPSSVAQTIVAPLPSSDDASTATQNVKESISFSSVLGSRTPPQIATYIATMKSMKVVEDLIKNHGIAPLLFPRQWNAQTKSWRERIGIVQQISNPIKKFLGFPAPLPPDDPTNVRTALDKMITVAAVDRELTPDTYAISASSGDPQVALKVLTLLHQEVLGQIRDREMKQASSIIAALQKLYAQTEVQNYRLTLSQMLADQQKKYLLLLDPNYPVSVEILDSPNIVKFGQRSLPLLTIIGFCLGAMVGVIFVVISFLRSFLRASTTLAK